MIDLQSVVRTYGAHVAVNELSLSVPAGELFAFLGPNGAGKTTTIKMLVGLLQPTSGSVRICGHDVVAEPRQASRHVGFVPDEPHLYDKLSGREFLQFVANLHGLAAEDAERQIAKQIDRFELKGFVDQLAESYSHGMKQRLIFGASLLHRPKVLILDEPMVGLDPRSMRRVKDILREESAGGTTIFMSTHTLPLAEEIATRIGVVSRGQLRFVGTVKELREKMERHDSSLEELFLSLTEGTDEPPPQYASPKSEPLFGE